MKKRVVDEKTILDKFVEEFCSVVNRHCKYAVCSGFVAIAHGRARGTEDIDMLIEKINFQEFLSLHNDLIKNDFVCIQSDSPKKLFYEYLKKGNSIRYVWKDEGFFPPEMELKFVKDELDEEQLKNRKKLPFSGLNVYFTSIESNIAFKEDFLGSQKDLEDAKHLRLIYKGKISEKEINKIKEKIKKYRK